MAKTKRMRVIEEQIKKKKGRKNGMDKKDYLPDKVIGMPFKFLYDLYNKPLRFPMRNLKRFFYEIVKEQYQIIEKHIKKHKILINEKQIQTRIKELAFQIFIDYRDKKIDEITLIFILNGAFIFASDLVRELSKYGMKIDIKCLGMRTYLGTESKIKNPEIHAFFSGNLKDKNVLIIEDILDTGYTLEFLNKNILLQKPKSLEYCCLLKKIQYQDERSLNFYVKYIGFEIPDVFVIGYGLDYNEFYRELPYIAIYEEDEIK